MKEIKLTIPDNWKDITIGTYQKYVKIQEGKGTDKTKVVKSLALLCNTSPFIVKKMAYTDLLEIMDIIKKMIDTEPAEQDFEYSIKQLRFFFDFRRKIGEDYAPLFGSSKHDTTKGVTMQSKWGWYNVLYSLSNSILDIEKITRLPILEVLTYLAYSQDYNNKQRSNYDNF
jgi:hypothetical protein